MPLELLEYQVFRQSGPTNQVSTSPFNFAEIDLDPVPLGQTWRIEHVSLQIVANFPANNQGGGGPYFAALYDKSHPLQGDAPIETTNLAPLPFINEFTFVAPGSVSWWGDYFEPAQPITIPSGNQFAVLFSPTANVLSYLLRVQYAIFQGYAGKPQPVAGAQPVAISPGI